MRTQIFKSQITNIFAEKREKYPDLFQRIDELLDIGRINLIIIDGKAQTGKSTTAKWICQHYDKEYTTIFTIEQLINYFLKAKEDIKAFSNRFVFFDEPQLQIPRERWWADRNIALSSITSSFGFLHNHLVMALPNIRGLSDIVLTNISLRISMISFKRGGERVFKAYVKKPIYDEIKRKWIWITVEDRLMPDLKEEETYLIDKTNNFFNMVDAWNKKITPIKEKDYLSPDFYK